MNLKPLEHTLLRCPDCGRKYVYGDSLARHMAVCSVRLRGILRDILRWADEQGFGGPNTGGALDRARQVLTEDGQGR